MSIENIDKLAQDVLFLSRNKLALNLRFMDKPISMLDLQKVPKLNGVAVDGTCIYYDPIVVLRNFSEEKCAIKWKPSKSNRLIRKRFIVM